jgi:hypothetical protein
MLGAPHKICRQFHRVRGIQPPSTFDLQSSAPGADGLSLGHPRLQSSSPRYVGTTVVVLGALRALLATAKR